MAISVIITAILWGLLVPCPSRGHQSLIQSIISLYKQSDDRLRFREDEYQFNLPSNKEYDFVVVGASPGGSVVASRLTENENVTVLVLEAGPERIFFNEIPMSNVYTLFTEYNWNYETEYFKGSCQGMIKQKCIWPSGRGFGGGTLINGMIYTRGNKNDFDEWARLGNEGWSYEDVLPYFIKVENMTIPELRDSPYHGTDGYLQISLPNYKTGLLDVFLAAGQQLGYNLTDYNAPNQHMGFSRIQLTINKGKRADAATAYLLPVRDRPNLHLLQRSYVTNILIDEQTKKAYGVEFYKNGKKRVVKARKEVIMAAGAFKTPQLLMLSGIGPKDHLESFGIPVLSDLPVGQNLQEHPGTSGLVISVEKKLMPTFSELRVAMMDYMNWSATGQSLLSNPGCEGVGYVKSTYAQPGDSPDIELIQVVPSFSSDNGAVVRKMYDVRDDVYKRAYKTAEGKHTFSIWVMEMYPKSRGYVELRSSDPFDPPLIHHNFFDDPQDVDVIVQGIKKVVELIDTPAMRAVGAKLVELNIPGCTKLKFNTDPYWECFVRQITCQYHHQCGTTSMGQVVDERLRVKGVQQLRVVDASVFPFLPGTHTQAPSYMVGEKAADLIKADHNLM